MLPNPTLHHYACQTVQCLDCPDLPCCYRTHRSCIVAAGHSCAIVQVTVLTSDIRFAGTDADVFAEFEGATGKFGPEALESSCNNFERSKRDDFVLRAVDIGSIFKVRIWHANNALAGSDWHLQEVR